MLTGQSASRPSGMAVMSWQPAPDTVAPSLKRRLPGTVPDRLPLTLGPAMGSGMASAAVKTPHNVLLVLLMKNV